MFLLLLALFYRFCCLTVIRRVSIFLFSRRRWISGKAAMASVSIQCRRFSVGGSPSSSSSSAGLSSQLPASNQLVRPAACPSPQRIRRVAGVDPPSSMPRISALDLTHRPTRLHTALTKTNRFRERRWLAIAVQSCITKCWCAAMKWQTWQHASCLTRNRHSSKSTTATTNFNPLIATLKPVPQSNGPSYSNRLQ